MGFTPEQLKEAFSWGKTPLTQNVSMFEDFWGIVEEIVPDSRVDEVTKQVTPSFKCVWKIDNTEFRQNRWWPVPMDRSTGEVRVDEEGNPARPNTDSTWGKQEQYLTTSMGLETGGFDDLVGMHVHVKKFEIKIPRRTGDPIDLTGLYMFEWDGYDNVHRRLKGLPAKNGGGPPAAQSTPVVVEAVGEDLWEHVTLLLDGDGSYITYRARAAEMGTTPVNQADFDAMRDSGILTKTRGIYGKGPNFEAE